MTSISSQKKLLRFGRRSMLSQNLDEFLTGLGEFVKTRLLDGVIDRVGRFTVPAGTARRSVVVFQVKADRLVPSQTAIDQFSKGIFGRIRNLSVFHQLTIVIDTGGLIFGGRVDGHANFFPGVVPDGRKGIEDQPDNSLQFLLTAALEGERFAAVIGFAK